MIGTRKIAVALLGLAGLLVAEASLAAVINVDIASNGADATHSGADGVLSTGGAVWNGVLYNTTSADVDDEGGGATLVDVAPTPFFSPGSDGSATNDLQDSGMFGNGFDIADLVAGNTYTLAVYGGAFLGFGVTDANGTTGGPCTSFPTYVLPGTAGSDYCIYSGLHPFDLGGGVMGIRVSGTDGLITGFQISGAFVPDETGLPALGPLGAALLALSLGGTSVGSLVRRRGDPAT